MLPPAIAVDSGGRIFVSYRMVPSASPMLRDIAVARSDDDGHHSDPSWSIAMVGRSMRARSPAHNDDSFLGPITCRLVHPFR